MTTEAQAKVNFTLEVFPRRVDGFHALRSVVVPVSLADSVSIEPDSEITSDTGYPDDLCVKAARALDGFIRRRGGSAPSGARIHVEKRIPAGGGLGGGSADAAAVLRALNGMWGTGLSPEELAGVGALVGSDVPALVLAQHYRAPVLMEGRGEVVARLGSLGSSRVDLGSSRVGVTLSDAKRPYLSLSDPNPTLSDPKRPYLTLNDPNSTLSLVLVNPGVFSSTPQVFANCTPRLQGDPSILYNMRTALESGDAARIASALQNDLDAPACALHPEIAAAKSALADAGAIGVAMSGSGSTVFGLVPSEARGREIAALLGAKGLWARSVTACPVV